jgi:hypothetical protein
LKSACGLGVAASLGAVASPLAGCGSGSADAATPPRDYSYAKLDPEVVRKRGHLEYNSGLHCCEGAFRAIIAALGDEVGAPFDTFPTKTMFFGAGGVSGFATLCGALNGSCAAISLVSDGATTMALTSELLSWYAQASLPSAESNAYAVNHEYETPEYLDVSLPQSVAGGNLCHQSVTNWCTANGYASKCAERAERCGRLCGDVAAKAVELLNAQYDETFVSAYPLPADAAGCRACHKMGEDPLAGQFTRGKMDCRTCHVDPPMSPH